MPRPENLAPEHLKSLLGGIDPETLQQVMPLTGGVVTMMFTDIVNSTAIKARLGDRPYFKDVLSPHNALVRERMAAYNGRELKTMGDAFLVGFALPRPAVDCAIDVQQRLAAAPIPAEGKPLEIRIGLHTGTPHIYRDPASMLVDLSGTDVDKAARIGSLAGGGQGPGGIGKTRLADEIATRVADRFEDGVHTVELAQTANSETAVAREVVQKLEVEVEKFPDEPTALTQTLRSRKALVVLDNFEAVMSAAPLVDRLLRQCPALHLLVTSQELRGVDSEQQLDVAVLPTAVAASVDGVDALTPFDGFKLFEDRARLLKADWSPSAADAPLVAAILEATDGIRLLIFTEHSGVRGAEARIRRWALSTTTLRALPSGARTG